MLLRRSTVRSLSDLSSHCGRLTRKGSNSLNVLRCLPYTAKIVKNCQIEVRLMDKHTQRVLNAQFLAPRESWKCAGADCRADVSIWNNKCDKCFRKRMFGSSRVQIATNDWLCSM